MGSDASTFCLRYLLREVHDLHLTWINRAQRQILHHTVHILKPHVTSY